MKRSLIKAGSIINIIFSVISTFFYGYFTFAVYIALALVDSFDGTADEITDVRAMFIISIAIFILSITVIVLSAIALKKSKLNVRTFHKNKGAVVALLVCTILLALLNIYYIGLSEIALLLIINMIVYVLTSIFVLVDLCKNKKALKNAPVEEIMTQTAEQPAEQAVSTKPTQVRPVENIEDRLIKLNSLREQGLITNEEYEKLKQDLLK